MKIKGTLQSLALLILYMMSTKACTTTSTEPLKRSENKVGIGLLHCSPESVIKFYQDYDSKSPYDSLKTEKVRFGLNKGKANFKTSSLGSKLQPYVLVEGDSDLEGKSNINVGLIRFSPEIIFRVLEKKGDEFTVLINEKSGYTSVIKLHKKNDYRTTQEYGEDFFFDPNFVDTADADWYLYESWEQALKGAWSIEVPKNTLFFKEPNGEQTYMPTNDYGFGIDSLSGDWARFYRKFPDDDSEKNSKSWAKWKNKDGIIVNIILHGGYE